MTDFQEIDLEQMDVQEIDLQMDVQEQLPNRPRININEMRRALYEYLERKRNACNIFCTNYFVLLFLLFMTISFLFAVIYCAIIFLPPSKPLTTPHRPTYAPRCRGDCD